MNHPYGKFIKIELLLIACTVLFGLVALFQGYLFLVLVSFYLIAGSLLCDALVSLKSNHTAEAGKQITRALMLVLLVTFVVFHF